MSVDVISTEVIAGLIISFVFGMLFGMFIERRIINEEMEQ